MKRITARQEKGQRRERRQQRRAQHNYSAIRAVRVLPVGGRALEPVHTDHPKPGRTPAEGNPGSRAAVGPGGKTERMGKTAGLVHTRKAVNGMHTTSVFAAENWQRKYIEAAGNVADDNQ